MFQRKILKGLFLWAIIFSFMGLLACGKKKERPITPPIITKTGAQLLEHLEEINAELESKGKSVDDDLEMESDNELDAEEVEEEPEYDSDSSSTPNSKPAVNSKNDSNSKTTTKKLDPVKKINGATGARLASIIEDTMNTTRAHAERKASKFKTLKSNKPKTPKAKVQLDVVTEEPEVVGEKDEAVAIEKAIVLAKKVTKKYREKTKDEPVVAMLEGDDDSPRPMMLVMAGIASKKQSKEWRDFFMHAAEESSLKIEGMASDKIGVCTSDGNNGDVSEECKEASDKIEKTYVSLNGDIKDAAAGAVAGAKVGVAVAGGSILVRSFAKFISKKRAAKVAAAASGKPAKKVFLMKGLSLLAKPFKWVFGAAGLVIGGVFALIFGLKTLLLGSIFGAVLGASFNTVDVNFKGTQGNIVFDRVLLYAQPSEVGKLVDEMKRSGTLPDTVLLRGQPLDNILLTYMFNLSSKKSFIEPFNTNGRIASWVPKSMLGKDYRLFIGRTEEKSTIDTPDLYESLQDPMGMAFSEGTCEEVDDYCLDQIMQNFPDFTKDSGEGSSYDRLGQILRENKKTKESVFNKVGLTANKKKIENLELWAQAWARFKADGKQIKQRDLIASEVLNSEKVQEKDFIRAVENKKMVVRKGNQYYIQLPLAYEDPLARAVDEFLLSFE